MRIEYLSNNTLRWNRVSKDKENPIRKMESRINDYYGCMMRIYAVKETSEKKEA